MTIEELKFCEAYEAKAKEHELLTIVKSSMTDTGLQTYGRIEDYLKRNLDRYLTIQGRS